MDLATRIQRDEAAAKAAREAAEQVSYAGAGADPVVDTRDGLKEPQRERQSWRDSKEQSIDAIIEHPFHAMMEVVAEVDDRGSTKERSEVWYAHEEISTNQPLGTGANRINVLAWTHPGVQLALAGGLGDWHDISASGYRLTGIETKARARFDAVLPEIRGLYEPGGAVRAAAKVQQSVGLKAVKLAMTQDQVNAFISRMTGLMIVTGAPGSGKTTVAFQRIRFLFDQQGLRSGGGRIVPFTPDRTRVFLANPNLVSYSRRLLVEQLSIPDHVVELVEPFIDALLDRYWSYTHEARPRQRRINALELKARKAYFGLCDSSMLSILWKSYEKQIGQRLQNVSEGLWSGVPMTAQARNLSSAFAQALVRCGGLARDNGDPLASRVRLDDVYRAVARPYESLRSALTAAARDAFDEMVERILFHVYDPLAAIEAAFVPRRLEGGGRIARGTGHKAQEADVLDAIASDLTDRRYGPEEKPWLAWLLRFALSEVEDSQGQNRFRLMPGALDLSGGQSERWTHLALDEAQDLSVAEASLIGSFVHPDGAVTVSADFRQAVTPTKGMEDASALSIGLPLRDTSAKTTFRFGRNMRQSKQIGRFLQSFHEAAFGELAPFDVNPDLTDVKPRLILAPEPDQPRRISQLLNVFRRSGTMGSIAILQINEDEEALMRLRAALMSSGAVLAPPWQALADAGVITTSVERIKGLEFDACIVLGLEDVERETLNFTLNRAYVGLSRAARRLAIVCEQTPPVLKRVDASLYDVSTMQGA